MANSFIYGGDTILSHPIFVETILPFILVFTIVFGILQKSKIFGDGKKQIDSLVALVAGLLLVSFAQAVGIILQLTVFLSVSLVVILVLLLILGAFVPEGKFFETMMPKAVQYTIIPLAFVAVTIAVVYITGFWEYLYDWIYLGSESTIFINIFFVAVVVGAIIAVISGKSGGK